MAPWKRDSRRVERPNRRVDYAPPTADPGEALLGGYAPAIRIGCGCCPAAVGCSLRLARPLCGLAPRFRARHGGLPRPLARCAATGGPRSGRSAARQRGRDREIPGSHWLGFVLEVVLPARQAWQGRIRMTCPVAAIVVAYESIEELPACLAALEGRVSQAVVVDNAPSRSASRQLRERHSWAVWIDNACNRGFAAAVNQGIAVTSELYVLLLNPDCELLTDLDALVEACQRDGVAGAGGLLTHPGGTPQLGFNARSLPTPWALVFEVLGINRIWKRNPVNRRYRLLDLEPGREREIQQPAGAFLMLRRDALPSCRRPGRGIPPGLVRGCRPLPAVPRCWIRPPLCSASGRAPCGRACRRPAPRASEAEGLVWWIVALCREALPARHFSLRRFAVLTGLILRQLYCTAVGGPSATADAYGATYRFVRIGFPRRADAS